MEANLQFLFILPILCYNENHLLVTNKISFNFSPPEIRKEAKYETSFSLPKERSCSVAFPAQPL